MVPTHLCDAAFIVPPKIVSTAVRGKSKLGSVNFSGQCGIQGDAINSCLEAVNDFKSLGRESGDNEPGLEEIGRTQIKKIFKHKVGRHLIVLFSLDFLADQVAPISSLCHSVSPDCSEQQDVIGGRAAKSKYSINKPINSNDLGNSMVLGKAPVSVFPLIVIEGGSPFKSRYKLLCSSSGTSDSGVPDYATRQ